MNLTIILQAAAAIVILLGKAPLAMAQDAELIAKLKTEKVVIEKRLAEINSQLGADGSETKYLGMTLVDPTGQLIKDYDLPRAYPGPIIAQFQDKSVFPDGMKPGEGCAFWIIENPANGFGILGEKLPSYWPKTVRELTEAILACTASPEEFEAIWNQARTARNAYAETFKDQPTKREEILKGANEKMPDEFVGKYICRVVYNYPGQKHTMTTQMRMTKADLDEIRKSLKN